MHRVNRVNYVKNLVMRIDFFVNLSRCETERNLRLSCGLLQIS